jgi:hypothetical protein
MDRTTRYGSCVPVTTIGIAPIFEPKASWGTHPPTHPQVYFNAIPGAIFLRILAKSFISASRLSAYPFPIQS